MSQGLCPSCGAAVNLAAETTEAKCQYCDSSVTLQQAETKYEEIKNSKVGGKLLLAGISYKSQNYAKALEFYDKVLEEDETSAEAWFGRGCCLVMQKNIKDMGPAMGSHLEIDTKGAIASFEAAIQFALNSQNFGG